MSQSDLASNFTCDRVLISNFSNLDYGRSSNEPLNSQKFRYYWWNFPKYFSKFSEITSRKFPKLFEIFLYNSENFPKYFPKFYEFSKIFSPLLWWVFYILEFLEHPNPLKKFSPPTNFLYNFMT